MTTDLLDHDLLHRISELKEAYGEDIFESGECANLARALVYILQKQGKQAKYLLVFHHEVVDADDDEDSTRLSHVAVEHDGHVYDIGGVDADTRWEARWDPDSYPELSEGRSHEFSYSAITDEHRLVQACEKWRVKLDPEKRDEYLDFMESLSFSWRHTQPVRSMGARL